MFKELYKKKMDDVKPDELLVQKTKTAMHKEINNKHKSYYKYITAAACLIITFSFFRFTFNTSMNNAYEADTVMDSLNSQKGDVPINSYFSVSSCSSDSSLLSIGESNIFIRFIKSIIEWFKNLFN